MTPGKDNGFTFSHVELKPLTGQQARDVQYGWEVKLAVLSEGKK